MFFIMVSNRERDWTKVERKEIITKTLEKERKAAGIVGEGMNDHFFVA